MIGLYGPIVFGVAGFDFEDMKKSVSARWGTHEIWQDKPLLEYAGASLIEVEFKMVLIKPYADPKVSIVILQETMDLGLPYPLVIGMLPIGRGLSLFVMVDLAIEYQYFYRGGGIMGATATVKLKEYPNPNLIKTLLQALGGNFGQAGGTAPTTAAPTTGQIAPDATAPSDPVVTDPEVVPDNVPNTQGGINPDNPVPPQDAEQPQVPQTNPTTTAPSGPVDLDNIGINDPRSPQNQGK